ncbi:MAG TPA: hypothetical protein VGP82_11510, partial [Ktedonobacterales bacterium]|nr:hypothetical protein [Ktedonobacterales bacterium]
LEQRKTWWGRGQGNGAPYYQQAMELPDLKASCPEYVEVNAQVVQDVLRRLDKTFQAFFHHLQAGETPGYPRFQGAGRYHSFTYPQYGGGAELDEACSVSPSLGASLSACIDPWKVRPRL